MTHPTRIAFWLSLALLFAPAARAAAPVDPSATDWVGTAQVKAKIPGAGNGGGLVDFELLFGPNGGAGLSANQFHMIADDGSVAFDVVGTWTVDAKGQPVLTLDTGALSNELKTEMQHVCEQLVGTGMGCDIIATLDVVYPKPPQVKVKTRNGTVPILQVSAKIPFALTDGINSVKLSLSLKTSPPAVPAP